MKVINNSEDPDISVLSMVKLRCSNLATTCFTGNYLSMITKAFVIDPEHK